MDQDLFKYLSHRMAAGHDQFSMRLRRDHHGVIWMELHPAGTSEPDVQFCLVNACVHQWVAKVTGRMHCQKCGESA